VNKANGVVVSVDLDVKRGAKINRITLLQATDKMTSPLDSKDSTEQKSAGVSSLNVSSVPSHVKEASKPISKPSAADASPAPPPKETVVQKPKVQKQKTTPVQSTTQQATTTLLRQPASNVIHTTSISSVSSGQQHTQQQHPQLQHASTMPSNRIPVPTQTVVVKSNPASPQPVAGQQTRQYVLQTFF